MSDSIGLKLEYDNILCGNQTDFSPFYVKKEVSQEDYIALMRYFFEDILGWNPSEVERYASYDIIRRMHLDKIYDKIEFPPELNKATDLFYLAHILYPSFIEVDRKAIILAVYKKVLSGKLKKFPKNFFFLADSENYLFNCLNHAIEENLFFGSAEELYSFFADKDKADPFLEKVRLSTPCRDLYGGLPVAMLHDYLPEDQKDESYYSFFKLMSVLE